MVLLLPESVEDLDELSLLDLAAVSDLESLEDSESLVDLESEEGELSPEPFLFSAGCLGRP